MKFFSGTHRRVVALFEEISRLKHVEFSSHFTTFEAEMTTISELRAQIYEFLETNECSEKVVAALYDGESFIEQEDYLWDYKAALGIDGAKPGSKSYQAKVCEIAKDVVAFHNTLGGYLVFGVEDKTGKILGCEESFPDDDLSARLKSDLRKNIDITVRRINFQKNHILLVHIPRKLGKEQPKAFVRPAKAAENGRQAYKQNDIYYRDGIGSSPARGDALASLVAGRFEIPGLPHQVSFDQLTENNLPARNFEKRDFVGRQSYLDMLWRWLLDPFTPIKLVSGIGGLGKTTLVRRFVEDVLERPPEGFENLIWFSAKSIHFDAETAKFVTTHEDDPNFFNSSTKLYEKLLSTLGIPDEELETLTDDEELLSRLIDALTLFPSLVVVDDLDSLSKEEQAQIFQELGMVFSRTAALSAHPSRCVFTARELVGAAPRQTVKLQGFGESEFLEHLQTLYERFGMPMRLERKQHLFKRFLKESGGSPLFAASIVRLVHGGLSLDEALNRFRGKEGEEVRSFAFEREIGRLAQGQLRCLFALIQIAPCSRVELADVLEVSEDQLLQDMGNLRDFHLVERDDSTSARGREYNLEGYVKLLGNLVEAKIADPRKIERRCKEIRGGKKARRDDVGKIIGQAVSLWRIEDHEGALNFLLGQRKLRKNEAFTSDLKCLLGRAYLRADIARWKEAEKCLREAYAEGCQRPELLELWIEALEIGKDWNGVSDVAQLAIKDTSRSKYYLVLGNATLEQANLLVKGGDQQAAIDLLSRRGKRLNEAFVLRHAHPDFSSDISSLRNQCFRSAIALSSQEHRASADKVYLWDLSWRAFENFARTRNILAPGVFAVQDWAEFKQRFSDNPARGDLAKFNEAVGRLSEMLELFHEKKWTDKELVAKTEDTLKFVMNARDKIEQRLETHDNVR